MQLEKPVGSQRFRIRFCAKGFRLEHGVARLRSSMCTCALTPKEFAKDFDTPQAADLAVSVSRRAGSCRKVTQLVLLDHVKEFVASTENETE